MSHDKYLFMGQYDFPEGVSFYPRFYPGTFFHLLGFAAVIGNRIPVTDNRLVSAPTQCKVHGDSGTFIGFHISRCIHIHTDTQGNGQIISDVDGAHLIQDGKSGFHKLFQVLLFKYENELILLKLFNDGIQALHVFDDFSLHKCQQKRLSDLFHAFKNFFVIINVNQSGNKTFSSGFFLILHQSCFIKEIKCQYIFIVGLLFRISDDLIDDYILTVHTIFFLAAGYVNLLAASFLRKYFLIQSGKHLSNIFLGNFSIHQFQKALIVPDNISRTICQNIRYWQLLKKAFLHLPLLEPGTAKLHGNVSLKIFILNHRKNQINSIRNAEQISGFRTDICQPDTDYKKGSCHDNRQPQIPAESF